MHKKLILVGACLVSSTLVGCGEAKVEWNCEGTGPSSLQCEVKNSGTASGEACFDIALVCSDGDHLSHFCTGIIEPGAINQKVVTKFTPEIDLNTECQGMEYRNQKITVQ